MAVSGRLTGTAVAQGRADLSAAFAAIRAYGEKHRSYFNLPGMTLGVIAPDGQRNVLNFGYANADARTAITSDTLFQIGSITKVMTAAVLHQLAAEGRLRLTDRISGIVPELSLPAANSIEVRHVLDHVAGLPTDAPMFPEGGLWTAYAPGTHWHYSNTGYEILGKLAEHVAQKPLRELFQDRIFVPLGMTRSRGAILGRDRALYAQGYEAADPIAVYARGVPLRPAPWVDVTAGMGCVASTAQDMLPFLRALTKAAQGNPALGLSAEQARAFAGHAVATDTPGMGYGNGLMHVGHGGRAYLHHTGGMLSFSSSFHADVASGVGAFASSTITAFADYRPRLLTRFAVDAVTAALSGRPLPPPPPLQAGLANAASYVGRYAGPAGEFEVKPGAPLTMLAGGQEAPLEIASEDVFATRHPLFRNFSIMFERSKGKVALASCGPDTYVRVGAGAELPRSNASLGRLAGRYIDDNPWYGAAQVVERGGKLWLGTETAITRIGENLWRVGKESWTPERASFANFIDGRPQTFIFSGEKFVRHDA
ncbi:MAG: serine hydrolase domain-containing protein [Sphingomicrobium sp.]